MEQDKVSPQPVSPTPQPNSPPAQQSQQPVTPPQKTNKKTVVIIVAVILILATVGISAFFLMQSKATKPTPASPQSSQQTKPTTVVSPTSSPPAQLTFTSTKIPSLSFPAFALKYTSDWDKEEDFNEITGTLTLSKNEHQLKVFQAPREGIRCIFEDTTPAGDEENFTADYTGLQFTEFNNPEGTFRRVETESPEILTTYNFCYKSNAADSTFLSPTVYGDIVYTLPQNPDTAIVSEMDEIVKSLRIIPLAP